MYLIVYDTAVERNPKIPRVSRQHPHHVQRDVFEGEASAAQLRRDLS
jgi:CRISPR-associated protein Cas2